MQRRTMLSLPLFLSFCLPLALSQQPPQPRWVTTWATAQLLVRPATPPGAAQAAKQPPAAAGFPEPDGPHDFARQHRGRPFANPPL
jgi:hypothetical protein